VRENPAANCAREFGGEIWQRTFQVENFGEYEILTLWKKTQTLPNASSPSKFLPGWVSRKPAAGAPGRAIAHLATHKKKRKLMRLSFYSQKVNAHYRGGRGVVMVMLSIGFGF